MADRTSAYIFSLIFEALASGKLPTAEELWRMTRDYDFSPYQMGCDDALVKLGLLWICPCAEDEDRGGSGCYNYGPPKETATCRQCSRPRPAS